MPERRRTRQPGACITIIASMLVAGCLVNEGLDPPRGVLNFPVQLEALTREGESAPGVLYVANSNFDLLYNSATLQAYDLDLVNDLLDSRCTSTRRELCSVVPRGSVYLELDLGDLQIIEPNEGESLLVDEALIGSYTQSMMLGPNAQRLYLTVQGVSDLTHAIVAADGRFDCGNGFGAGEACTSFFTSTDRERAAERGVKFSPGPMALYVGSLEELGMPAGTGNYLLVTDRDESVSLFIDEGTANSRPELVDVVPSVVPGGAVTLSREPNSGHVWAPTILGSNISRFFPAIDAETDPGALRESRIAVLPAFTVRGLSSGSSADLRQVAFDPRPGNEDVYILSRAPAALVIAKRTGDLGTYPTPSLIVDRVIDLGIGPSRLELATFDVAGEPLLLAFITSFDSRDLYVVDVDRSELLSVAAGLSGPFDFVVDTARERLYIGEYDTSVVRFVNLAPMLACLEAGATPTSECTPELVGFLGVPNALEGLR
jgi:hypothetical protein